LEIRDYDNLESEDNEYLSDDEANHYTLDTNTGNVILEENIIYDDFRTEVDEHLSDYGAIKYIIQEKKTEYENGENNNCDHFNTDGYHLNDDRINECREENEIDDDFMKSKNYEFLMINENEYKVSKFDEKDQQNNLSKINQEKTQNILSKRLNKTTTYKIIVKCSLYK